MLRDPRAPNAELGLGVAASVALGHFNTPLESIHAGYGDSLCPSVTMLSSLAHVSFRFCPRLLQFAYLAIVFANDVCCGALPSTCAVEASVERRDQAMLT
eukprot:scaffold1726_cov260-Pinguiococcus_pyrenoidosus.AAC.15